MRALRILLVAALTAVPAAAPAQFSDGYNFLKAVRDRDVNKANDLATKPGSVLVDTRDISTGESALHIVTRARDLPWLNFILQKNAKPDIRDNDGNTPLMIAAQIGFIEGAQSLLRRRANVNQANSAGETPLIRAVQNRDLPMVRLLLGNGANPDKADTSAGLSARDYAARDRRSAPILKLIEDSKTAAAKPVSGPK
jgi:uncharacterized protein